MLVYIFQHRNHITRIWQCNILTVHRQQQQYFSAATIAQTTEDVFVVDDHVITCVLEDIPGQITGVLWTPAVEKENEYSLDDGTFSANRQESTLTITAAKLASLHLSSATQTFTCKITIGDSDTEITAIQTITIFNPSNYSNSFSVMNLHLIKSTSSVRTYAPVLRGEKQ